MLAIAIVLASRHITGMTQRADHRSLTDAQREAIRALEPAFPPRSPGVRAVAYGHALSDDQLETKAQVERCLKR